MMITFIFFLLAFLLLALGTFLSKREIKGSCGGINKEYCGCKDSCEEYNS